MSKLYWRLVSLAVLFATALSASAASASTANLSASVDNGDPFFYYSTVRSNTYAYNCMSFKLSSLKANTGGFVGLMTLRVTRKGSTAEIASLAVDYMDIGATRSFLSGGYGCRVPKSEFRFGIRINGHLDVNGSNPVTGKGLLTYNIKSSYTGGPMLAPLGEEGE